MIYAVLSNSDFVVKFTVKNLNKDFINAVRGGHRFMKVFHRIPVFFERWLPLQLLSHFSNLNSQDQVCFNRRINTYRKKGIALTSVEF